MIIRCMPENGKWAWVVRKANKVLARGLARTQFAAWLAAETFAVRRLDG